MYIQLVHLCALRPYARDGRRQRETRTCLKLSNFPANPFSASLRETVEGGGAVRFFSAYSQRAI